MFHWLARSAVAAVTADNVVVLPVVTRLDIPASRILDAAAQSNLTEVVVIGQTADGNEYFASSHASGPETLWHLERAKHKLMRAVE